MSKYFNYIFSIFFFLFLLSCNNEQQRILPNWKDGDYRYIKITQNLNYYIGSNTINTHHDNLCKITVHKGDSDYFHLQVENLSPPIFNSSADTLKPTLNDTSLVSSIIQSVSKMPYSYTITVAENGKILRIMNWENIRDKSINRIIQLADSIGFSYMEQAQLSYYFKSTFREEKNFQKMLLKDISEILRLYNIPLPIDTPYVIVKDIRSRQTGELLHASDEYRIMSSKNGTYEIKRIIDKSDIFYNKSKKDFLNDFINKEKSDSVNIAPKKKDEYFIFYWNSGTTWVDSMHSYLEIPISDTVKMVQTEHIKLYK